MKILINGEAVDILATTLADALAERGYGEAQVATAVNEVFVPKSRRTDLVLKAGDRIEVVAPRQGG